MVMLTESHGLYTKRSFDNLNFMLGGLVRIGLEVGEHGG